MRVRAVRGFLLEPGRFVYPGDVFELDGRSVKFEGGHQVMVGHAFPKSYYEVVPDPEPQPDPGPAPDAPAARVEPTHREPIVRNREARPRGRRASREV